MKILITMANRSDRQSNISLREKLALIMKQMVLHQEAPSPRALYATPKFNLQNTDSQTKEDRDWNLLKSDPADRRTEPQTLTARL